MKKGKFFALFVIAVFIAVITGCATLPSPEVTKAETASFTLPKSPEAGKAIVYVVRPSGLGGLIRFNVFLDDQEESSEMGYTRSSQYIYFSVPPGDHRVLSKAENWAETMISAKDGDIIYIQQEPAFGFVMARNSIFKVEELQGKYYVKTLKVGTILKTDK